MITLNFIAQLDIRQSFILLIYYLQIILIYLYLSYPLIYYLLFIIY